MAPADITKAYIYRLCRELGVSAETIYNTKTGAWYFSSGSSTIEVFLSISDSGQEKERTFIRCFAPVYVIPDVLTTKLAVYQAALEINTQRMGIKLSILRDKGLLCLVTERDIEGMDYDEFLSIITDISHWTDLLKVFFKKQFT